MNNGIGKRIDVLDKGFIELIDFMPHPLSGISGDLAIVNVARVSHLGESKGDVADRRLLNRLMRDNHTSPFECVKFSFRIHAPLVTYWQWVRHRTFQYMNTNSQSGRYTEFAEDDFYLPSEWRTQSAHNKQASSGVVSDADGMALDEALQRHYAQSFTLYEDALKRGVAREMARLFLPAFGVYYTWVVSVDALNLMNFLKLRMADDAQYEIRVYADAIYNEFFKPMLSWTAEAFEEYRLTK